MAPTLSTTDERILAKLATLNERFEELEDQMNDPEVASNSALIVKIAKEHGNLRELVGCYRQYNELYQQAEDAQTMIKAIR